MLLSSGKRNCSQRSAWNLVRAWMFAKADWVLILFVWLRPHHHSIRHTVEVLMMTETKNWWVLSHLSIGYIWSCNGFLCIVSEMLPSCHQLVAVTVLLVCTLAKEDCEKNTREDRCHEIFENIDNCNEVSYRPQLMVGDRILPSSWLESKTEETRASFNFRTAWWPAVNATPSPATIHSRTAFLTAPLWHHSAILPFGSAWWRLVGKRRLW